MNDQKVGLRVRKIREKRGISLEELAEQSELDLNFLRTLEEKNLSTSLGPLLKIARVLGCRLGTFLDDAEVGDPLVVRKSSRDKSVTMQDTGKSAALGYYSLGRGKSDRHMEPFFIEIDYSEDEEKRLSSHQGEEFIIVVSGRVELVYGNDVHLLEAGDSVYYNSVVPHHVGAYEGKAEIYAIIYVPF